MKKKVLNTTARAESIINDAIANPEKPFVFGSYLNAKPVLMHYEPDAGCFVAHITKPSFNLEELEAFKERGRTHNENAYLKHYLEADRRINDFLLLIMRRIPEVTIFVEADDNMDVYHILISKNVLRKSLGMIYIDAYTL